MSLPAFETMPAYLSSNFFHKLWSLLLACVSSSVAVSCGWCWATMVSLVWAGQMLFISIVSSVPSGHGVRRCSSWVVLGTGQEV